MTKHKHEQRHRQDSVEIHDPYWMRAHRDWRFLIIVFLMLAAIATYVLTGNLAWRPRNDQTLPLLDKGSGSVKLPAVQ